MTADVDLGRLLTAVERAGARMIVVGDYRQLDPVGPGGALEALAARHPERVWTLADNLRQVDPAERAALDQLRAGSVDQAVAFYADHDRIHAAPTQEQAVRAMVAAWAADVAAGHDSLLLAYRRATVDSLNEAARQAWAVLGRLSGPELHGVDGRVFQAGDRIVTLTPGPSGAWTTSQAARVVAVDPGAQALSAITPDGRPVHVPAEYLSPERIAHGYAVTVHRSQGSTVDTAHVLADGGGRELAYVAMSRARGPSHAHLVTVDPNRVAERLTWHWRTERRQTWTHQPEPSLLDLYAQRRDLQRSIPADRSAEVDHARATHTELAAQLDDLYNGRGRWADHPAGHAVRAGRASIADYHDAKDRAADADLGWWRHRQANRDLTAAAERYEQASRDWQHHGVPIETDYRQRLDQLGRHITGLDQAQAGRADFLAAHPDIDHQIAELTLDIERAEERRHRLEHTRRHHTILGDDRTPSRNDGLGRKPDRGLSL